MLGRAGLLLSALTASTAAAARCREAQAQPFSAASIWNTPIGANADLRGVGLAAFSTGAFHADTNYYVARPGAAADAVGVVSQGWWGKTPAAATKTCPTPYENNTDCHCVVIGKPAGLTLRLPRQWTTADGPKGALSSGNNGASIYFNTTHVVQMQPAYRCQPGSRLLARWESWMLDPPTSPKDRYLMSLWGEGLYGAHGGSGLSSLGGMIRRGELNASAPPIAHALSFELFANRWYFCSAAARKNASAPKPHAGCFRWPAITADSYAVKRCPPRPAAGGWNKCMAYNGSSPLLQPGTLLAVPQAAAAGVKTQLTTEIGRRILRAVVNFGAYATDDAAGTYLGRNGKTNINYEQGVDAEVHANYGLELSAFPGRNSSNSSWIFHDLTVVFRALRAVANNGAASVGGGGQPACGGCAPPPLCAPPTTAHKSDDGDAAASVATSTIDNTQPRRDQHGNILNAHDGHVVGPVDGLYWLIGTSYTHCDGTDSCLGTCGTNPTCQYPISPSFVPNHPACGWTNNDFAAYSSPDLEKWTLVNPSILPADKRPNFIYFRPKVMYNKATRTWVLWMNVVSEGWNETGSAFEVQHWSTLATATSSSISGPYKMAAGGEKPIIMGTGNASYAHGDFGVFTDDDGKGYILYNAYDHRRKKQHSNSVDLLTADFTSSTRRTSGFFAEWDSDGKDNGDEAQVLLKKNGGYYAIISQGCCFCKQGAHAYVYTAASPLGPFLPTGGAGKQPQDINGGGGGVAVPAQQSFVLTLPSGDMLWGGDRWQQNPDGFKSHDPLVWVPFAFAEGNRPSKAAPIAPLNYSKTWQLQLKTMDEAANPAANWDSSFVWNNGTVPFCAFCRGVVDGPLAANGDLGVVLGGGPGGDAFAKDANGTLGLFFGKGDFWGFPRAVTYHENGQRIPLPKWYGKMAISNASLAASAASADGNYSLQLTQAQVLLEPNVLVAELRVQCSQSAAESNALLTLNASIGSDIMFSMPTQLFAGASTAGAGAQLSLHKASVTSEGWNPAALLTCATEQIVPQSYRKFTLNASTRVLTVVPDGSLGRAADAARGPLCLLYKGSTIVTALCSEAGATGEWRLRSDGKVWSPASGQCLAAQLTNKNASAPVTCPPNSFYTDATSTGACQSSQWRLAAVPCPPAGKNCKDAASHCNWKFNASTGFLRSVVPASLGLPSRCLAAVPRSKSNNVAMAARFIDAATGDELASSDENEQTRSASASASGAPTPPPRDCLSSVGKPSQCFPPVKSAQLAVKCSDTLAIQVAVLTQKDAGAQLDDKALRAKALATVAAMDAPTIAHGRAALNTWWHAYFAKSAAITMPEFPVLERYYYSMLYLQRASMRLGKTAAGLWGPFSTTDFPGWSDQMTLDYNLEGNFWATTATNNPELMRLYSDQILKSRLVPLAKARAALPDWSLGGWPDVVGAEVSGSSCGPTPDWDHDFGCPKNFGKFSGMAFVSCTGPEEGMECCFDDGTRFVAGLVATPMLAYYDGTQDKHFLTQELLPYMKDVAAFYSSYAVINKQRGSKHFPFTCAQEICGGGTTGLNITSRSWAENDHHQDIAYAEMALIRLLEWTDPQNKQHQASHLASAAERATWRSALASLPPYPLTSSDAKWQRNATVFSEGATYERGRVWPVWHDAKHPQKGVVGASSNAGYPIAHLAAMHPARVIDPLSFSTGAATREIAYNTAQLMNVDQAFSPGNGFCLAWPSAALSANSSTARALLRNFSLAQTRIQKPNGWPDSGGGGLEQVGAVVAFADMLVRAVDGVLRLFPGWPLDSYNQAASFARIRVTGAFLVSASRSEHVRVAPRIEIVSDAGLPLMIPQPFSSGATTLCVLTGGGKALEKPLPKAANGSAVGCDGCFLLATKANESYAVVPCTNA